MGTRHLPHSARSCELALRAVGVARGRPGGAPLPWPGGPVGLSALLRRTARPWRVRQGSATHWLWMRGLWAWKLVTSPTARALASWLCALWGRHGGARGGASCLAVGRPGLGPPPSPDRPSLGRAADARYSLAVGARGVGVGTRHLPHSAGSCELALRAMGAASGRPGGAPLAWVWGVRGWALSPARPPFLGVCGLGPLPTGCGCGGLGLGTRHQPHSARSCELALPAVGAARARPGDASCPAPDCPFFGRAAGARYPLVVGAVCGPGGPVLLGTFVRAAIRRVLCALPGFAAPGCCCCLAPVLVPWLWLVACLSGVPRGPALLRHASCGPVALGALVGCPVAVVPSPVPGAVAPGFTRRLRGARGGWLRTKLIVPAAGPCRGRGAGLAPRRTRSGPRDGVVPGGSLRLRSWAACAAVVWRVWTRSLTRPVSCTVHRSTGDSVGAPGLCCADANTSLCGSEDATLGFSACVPVRALLGRVGGAGLSGAFWCASPFPWPFGLSSLFGPRRAGVARASCLPFFLCFTPFLIPLSSRAPAVSGFSYFLAPGALGLGALHLFLRPPNPPPFFVSFLSLCFVLLRCLPSCPLLPCSRCLLPALCAPGLGFVRSPPPPPPPPPPPLLFSPSPLLRPTPFFRLRACFFVFFSLFIFRAPPRLGCSFVSVPGCPGPGRFVAARPSFLALFLCLVFFFSLRVVCALCAAPPPPPWAAPPRVLPCLVSCCVVPRSVVGWFVWFVVFFRRFAVPCGAGVVLSGVLSGCVVGFVAGGLPRALLPSFLLVSCGALLCPAALCGALLCVVPPRVVVWCVVLCVVLVRCVAW